MSLDKALDNILNTGAKVRIMRLFASKTGDFMAAGREIARLVGLTAPAVHTALKELYNQDVLKRDIIGKQHIYRLNTASRIVKHILLPAFKTENSIKKDICDYLKKAVTEKKIKNKIISVILYGSLQRDKTDEKSDIDIAVITIDKTGKKSVEKTLIENIADDFYDYFGVHLDSYIKTKEEFINRMKNNQPPVSTLMKSYFVIFGKDPANFK